MNYSELSSLIQEYVQSTETSFVANIPQFVQLAEERIFNTVQIPALRQNSTATVSVGNQYMALPSDWLSTFSLAIINPSTNVYTYLLNKDVNFIREAYPSPTSTGQPRHYAIFGPTYSDTNELSFILGPTPDLSYGAELYYYYYPTSIVQSAIQTLGTITVGSAYTNGTYFNVPLTGGSGSGATAKIVVSGGTVSSVTLQNPGVFYAANDSLSAAASDIGGTGSGFSVTISAVSNPTGTSWLGDNFDSVLLNSSLVEAARFMKAEAETIANYDKLFMESAGLAKQLGDGKQRMDAYRDGQFRMKVS